MTLYAQKDDVSGRVVGATVELNYKSSRKYNYRDFKSLDSAKRWLKSIGYYCIGSEKIRGFGTHWYYQSKRKYPTPMHWYQSCYKSLEDMCTPESKKYIDSYFGISN